MNETVDRFVQMALQREVSLGLALLGATQHGVQLVDRFARHEGAQQGDRGADHGQVHMKIGSRVAKQRSHVGARQHNGVDLDALRRIREGEHQRRDGAVADQAADHEGMHAAIEHGFDQFDRFGGAAVPAQLEVSADFRADPMHRGFRVAHGVAERQVREQLPHGGGQRSAHPVDAYRHRA